MSDIGPAIAKILHDRIDNGGFAIALSGGGHRATLANIGALIAIIDRGLGSKIIQVASVSGGTITNAFVAQRCHLETLDPGQLDDVAQQLATTVIQKGVLTTAWLVFLIIAMLVVWAVATITFYTLVVPWTWLALAIGLSVALSLLLARGLLVEWLLDRRYFRHSTELRSHWSRARLASLSERDVDHVFCMTDLATGLPVYASSHGGMMWRRLKPETDDDGNVEFQTFDGGELSIAELTRASAAFPGIPPRRLKIPDDLTNELVSELPRVAFLADGGLWNNLGTQVMREDRFIGYAGLDHGVLRPYLKAPHDIPVLCFNGSAPLRPTKPWAFGIPGLALLKSALQYAQILSANTVLPRIEAMQMAFKHRNTHKIRPDSGNPCNLVADLTDTKDLEKRLIWSAWREATIRDSDMSVKKWESVTLRKAELARDIAAKAPDENWLDYIFFEPKPEGSYPVVGLANIDDWNALEGSPVWRDLVETDGTGRVDAPTTLDRIDRTLARQLIARGYLNTYLISLFLAPLSAGELDELADLKERLDRIVGIARTEAPSRQ